ncbi:MAG: hypothetical protein PHR16_17525 [Methylovulum sp.]|nr:hypothetical protein [Methylovulum sp.]
MEYSVFTKTYGNLTKEIRFEDGQIIKDASQCRMAEGTVKKVIAENLIEFVDQVKNIKQNQAIASGVAAECVADEAVRIVKKGNESDGSISRSKDFFAFTPGPTLMLLDNDPEKGKPALSIDEGYSNLIGIVPELSVCEVLALSSTSSGIYKEGETPPDTSTGGIHFYVVVDDGSKIPELGKTIAARCWLKGLGRFDISKSGSLLPRTLFDEAVFSPERLIFEATPVLGEGLKQLPRVVKHWQGGILKTSDVRGLTAAEEARVETLKIEAKAAKQPEADTVKAAHNSAEISRLMSKGESKRSAREQVEKANNGILIGSHPLQFAGLPLLTVADVLREPARYHENELIDPDESLDPNANFRAKLYRNDSGLMINSFRSGGGVYKLEKIEIKIDFDNPIGVFEQLEAALNTGVLPDIFVWGGCLAYVGNDGAVRTLTAVSAPVIVGRLVRFYSMKKVNEEWIRVRAELPDKLWKAFLEKGSWIVSRLEGVAHCPYFFNGEVIQSRGYNAKSRLYLTTDFNLHGVKNAALETAKNALAHLRGLMSGFPFETEVDEAVALAMMITAVQRLALETAPLFAISANTPGTGKTQLATGIASLATGENVAVHGYRDNEQETAKMLMSALLQGSPNIVIDNVKLGVGLGGDALCAVLSSPVYVDRELGFSRTRTVSTRTLVAATGNNLKLASDITRRALMITLDARCEQPELRQFEASFVQTCRAQRPAIVKSILTILSAYHTANSPKVNNVRLGTFEMFSDEICRPLVWLGLPDPVLGQAKADADESVAGLGELLTTWQMEIFDNSVSAAELSKYPMVNEWFRNEFEDRGGPTVQKISRFLGKFAGRMVGNLRIIKAGAVNHVKIWRLENVEPRG